MTPFLVTDRLELRRLMQDDAPALLEMNTDPDVLRYVGQLDWNLKTAQDWISDIEQRFYSVDSPYGYWSIFFLGESEFLGWAHLRPSNDDPDDIQLGYRLKRSAWGHGYATEVSKALLDYGFEQLGLSQVTATTHSENVRSQNVLLKVGMQQVGTFFHEPLQIDVFEYAIRKPMSLRLS